MRTELQMPDGTVETSLTGEDLTAWCKELRGVVAALGLELLGDDGMSMLRSHPEEVIGIWIHYKLDGHDIRQHIPLSADRDEMRRLIKGDE